MICVDTRVTILYLKVSKIRHVTVEMAVILKNGLQNGRYNGMIYPEIVVLKSTPQKTYIESTMIALRLLVIEIIMVRQRPF